MWFESAEGYVKSLTIKSEVLKKKDSIFSERLRIFAKFVSDWFLIAYVLNLLKQSSE